MNQKFIIYFEKEREEEGGLTQLNETKKADIETFFSIKSFNTLIGSGALYGKMLLEGLLKKLKSIPILGQIGLSKN